MCKIESIFCRVFQRHTVISKMVCSICRAAGHNASHCNGQFMTTAKASTFEDGTPITPSRARHRYGIHSRAETLKMLDVLRLVAEGLSRQEIAARLFLSLNTIKTHARNIYSKLGVHSQLQAVRKAQGLGLLEQK